MTTYSSLLNWLSTIELDGKPSIALDNNAYYNLADGYICARILNQISPKCFPDKWLDGIKPVPPDGSWRLRVSNLNRILQKIYDYGSDLQSTQSTNSGFIYRPERINPDVNVIAQNFHPDQINKLIQLILFCAINCEEKKDYYIEKIVNLPYKVDIKEAIEQLLAKNPESSHETSSVNTSDQINPNQLGPSPQPKQTSNTSQVLIGEKNSFLENSTQNLLSPFRNLIISSSSSASNTPNNHNTSALLSDRGNKKSQLGKSSILDKSNSDTMSTTSNILDTSSKFEEDLLIQQNRRLNSQLHEKNQELINIETERDDFRIKCNLLKADLDKITLKHDLALKKAENFRLLQDELDEFRQKIVTYEQQVQNLDRKNAELRQELQIHQDKSCSQMERIIALEEENGQLSNGANQIQFYKKKVQEIQTKLSQESHRGEKLEDDLNKLTEKYSTIKKENERLYETTNQLLASSKSTANAPSTSEPSASSSVGGNINNNPGSSENTANLINRVEQLQRLLFQREQELAESESKYQKNIKKAKEVIRQLGQASSQQNITTTIGTTPGSMIHPSCISSVSSFNSNSLDENSVLKQQLKEREDRIVELEREFYEFKKVKEIHERLMITAFYGLTTPMQWKNAEKRLERSMNPMSTSNNNSNNSPSMGHMKHSH